MKSYGGLWKRIVSKANMMAGWEEFRRRHSSDPKVRAWAPHAEQRIEVLREELIRGAWHPGRYKQFKVFEPKPRVISRAPIADRIVHHALCNLIAPLLERKFISQTYACRRRKGGHLACARARELAAQGGYFLKMDVRKYFPSIDNAILKRLLSAMFREREVRELAARIIDNRAGMYLECTEGKGLPIGNLTSQWFANFYLDGLDHFVTEQLGMGGRYLRFMDDTLVFCDSKESAWRIHDAVREWLRVNRNMELKEEATLVAPVSEGVPYLGLRIWGDRWRFQRSRYLRAMRTAERRYEAHAYGEECADKCQNCGRAQDGAIRWFGFTGILKRTGEKTLERNGLEAADDGLPLRKVAGVRRGGDSPSRKPVVVVPARSGATSLRTATTTTVSALPAPDAWGNASPAHAPSRNHPAEPWPRPLGGGEHAPATPGPVGGFAQRPVSHSQYDLTKQENTKR